MKVYLSMSSADLDAARAQMQAIRDMGHEVVLDWTKSFDTSVPESEWPRLVYLDVDCVRDADCMVLVGQPTSGCFVELGAAIANSIPVVWVTDSPGWPDDAHFFMHYAGLENVNSEQLGGSLDFAEVCVKRRKPLEYPIF